MREWESVREERKEARKREREASPDCTERGNRTRTCICLLKVGVYFSREETRRQIYYSGERKGPRTVFADRGSSSSFLFFVQRCGFPFHGNVIRAGCGFPWELEFRGAQRGISNHSSRTIVRETNIRNLYLERFARVLGSNPTELFSSSHENTRPSDFLISLILVRRFIGTFRWESPVQRYRYVRSVLLFSSFVSLQLFLSFSCRFSFLSLCFFGGFAFAEEKCLIERHHAESTNFIRTRRGASLRIFIFLKNLRDVQSLFC